MSVSNLSDSRFTFAYTIFPSSLLMMITFSFVRLEGEGGCNSMEAFVAPATKIREDRQETGNRNGKPDKKGPFRGEGISLRQPRIERGAHRWQRWILPLNH